MAGRKWLLLLFLSAAISGLVYARTVTYEFVYDDKSLIAENPQIRDWGKVPEMLLEEDWIDEIHVGFYRPLFLISLAADYYFWGANPFGFHLSNVLLHMTAVALVYLLALRLLGNPAAAFVSSLFFGLHPANTEAVVFLSARNNLLCAIFLTLSSIAGPGFGGAEKGIGRRALSLVFFFLGLLSKETAIMLPFVLMGAGLLLKRPGKPASYVPHFIVLAVYFILRRIALEGFLGIDIRAGELGSRLTGMLTALASYVRLSLLPLGQKAIYDVDTTVSVRALMSFLALLALAAAVFKKRGDIRVAFPAVWFFGFLIPVMNIVPIAGSMMAERYLYIPLIGGSIIAGGLYSSLSGLSGKSGRRYTAVAFGLTLAAFSVLTLMRTPVWKNDAALYGDMIKTTPTSYKGYYNLGNIMYREGRLEEAERLWSKVVEVRPDMFGVRNNLGVLYEKTGDYEKAEDQYRAVLEIRSIPEVYRNLGNALRGQKRFSEAQEAYERAIAMSPGNLEAYVGLTELYEETGRPELALRAMEGAIKNLPGSYMAYNIAGTVLGKMGRYEEAGRYFAKSLEIDPSCYECRYNMELIRKSKSGAASRN